MDETREVQKQDIDDLLYSLQAIERLLSDVKLLLEWRFRDDPKSDYYKRVAETD
jgi:hypothetical protein